MIKYLQLQKFFDPTRLKSDLFCLEKDGWTDHYNKAHYQGTWRVLPLRSINGSINNAVSVHASGLSSDFAYKDTPLLKRCRYIPEVLQFFQCEKTTVRLMNLSSGSIIKEHCDHELNFEQGEVRFHIPVQTNTGVHFMLENERIIMQEGMCWYLNLSLKHSVRNDGPADRVHLVIDCKTNDWVRNLFAHHALLKKETTENISTSYTRQEQLEIIEQLKIMNTPVSLELAAKLEKELP